MTSAQEYGDRCVALFDIGTGNISGSLVLMSLHHRPRIIAAHTYKITLDDEANHSLGDIVREIARGVESVGDALVRAGAGAPVAIEAYISSSWTTSQTRTITFQKNRPFVVKESMVLDMLEREYRLFSEKERALYQQVGDDIFRIDVEVTDSFANGYRVSELFGKTASDINLVTYMSVTSRSLVDVLNESFSKVFHSTPVRYRSYSLAQFALARVLYPHIDRSVHVGIRERETEIMLVTDTTMKKTVTFPVGSQVFIDAVAEQFGCTDTEAETYLTLHQEKHLAQEQVHRIEGAIARASKTWLELFQKALIVEGERALIPETVILFSKPLLADIFSEVIGGDVFIQYRLTDSTFTVRSVENEILRHFIDSDAKTHPVNTVLVGGIFSNMLYQKK
ncbi:hypothetical protein IT403_00885 [Candidatus Nomurabacteria bacterium]|nr:hypothetical protein [Candidatus Nomurabacteria bacterium]